jgi:hypothetical protein
MSNEWDDGTEENPAELEGTEGIANLRKAYERKAKQEKELRDKLAALESRERERTLSDVLSAHGANAKLAKFYPANGESTPEAVEAWLTENAEVFGQTRTPQAPAQPQVSPELRNIYDQFQTPGMNSPTQDEESAIRNYTFGDPANSEAEIQKFMSFMRNNPGAVHNPGV